MLKSMRSVSISDIIVITQQDDETQAFYVQMNMVISQVDYLLPELREFETIRTGTL